VFRTKLESALYNSCTPFATLIAYSVICIVNKLFNKKIKIKKSTFKNRKSWFSNSTTGVTMSTRTWRFIYTEFVVEARISVCARKHRTKKASSVRADKLTRQTVINVINDFLLNVFITRVIVFTYIYTHECIEPTWDYADDETYNSAIKVTWFRHLYAHENTNSGKTISSSEHRVSSMTRRSRPTVPIDEQVDRGETFRPGRIRKSTALTNALRTPTDRPTAAVRLLRSGRTMEPAGAGHRARGAGRTGGCSRSAAAAVCRRGVVISW